MVNYWAVLVSAIASMVIGSFWYGPLFGKMFMQAMGMDKMTPEQMEQMKKGMGMTYALQFAASLVTFYVLAMLTGKVGALGVQGGMLTAFWTWLGFVMPVKLGDALWGGKMKLFWIGSSYMLVNLLVAGAIIGVWM